VRRSAWWRLALVGACTGGVLLAALGASVGAGAAVPDPEYYIAVGGSGSVGEQPSATSPHGAPTDRGYANDFLAAERTKWADLRLVQLGCPGETTAMMLLGGSPCRYALGSQLADAVSFIVHHPSNILMTVDLGFNDLLPCLANEVVNEPCANRELAVVHDQLAQILNLLRSAGGDRLQIVGIGHYDPYLADYLDGPAGQAFASSSLAVINRLNDVLRADFTAAHASMADVAGAFEMTSTEPTTWPGSGLVPRNVARTCALTWMCAAAPLGPNKHANDDGYRVIGEAIADAVAGH
jgi:lysophospholipase L1-like esterase